MTRTWLLLLNATIEHFKLASCNRHGINHLAKAGQAPQPGGFPLRASSR